MLQSISPNLQLILNSVQLSIYVIIVGLSIYKLVKSLRVFNDFFSKFYGSVTALACIEIGMQWYQLTQQVRDTEPKVYVLVIVNLYAMTCEAVCVLLLSDYWNQTKQIITKTSTEIEIRQEKHLLRYFLLLLWLLAYTAFIVYALSTNSMSNEAIVLLLTLGCQGIAATILLWSILVQIIRGNHLQTALGRYEQSMNGSSIKKGYFRSVYWVTSICNFLRIIFLILVTIAIVVNGRHESLSWLAMYIYTASNCIVLFAYIFGLSTRAFSAADQNNRVTTIIQGRLSSSSRGSRHETELSQTSSNRSSK